MKILHTADLHLLRQGDERWNTFQKILDLGAQEHIDAMVIAGDLLDKDLGSSTLLYSIAELLSKYNYKIIIIRGNHDKNNLDNQNLGDNVKIIQDHMNPVIIEEEGVVIWGLPYEHITPEDQWKTINKIKMMNEKAIREYPNYTHLLLFHGDVISKDVWMDSENEEEGRYTPYMPINKRYFINTLFRYILAGHIHSKFQRIPFGENNRVLVYPGSPIPIKKSELGIRSVNIFEIGNEPQKHELDSPFYEKIDLIVKPQHESICDTINENKDFLDLIQREGAHLSIKINGYIDEKITKLPPDKFVENSINYLNEKYGDKIEILTPPLVRDVSYIKQNEYYKLIREKLTNKVKGDISKYEDFLLDVLLEVFKK